MTNKELNAEFSISITKKAGDPQMDFNCDGDINDVGSGMVRVLACLTARADNVNGAMEQIIDAYRGLVCEHMERMGRRT